MTDDNIFLRRESARKNLSKSHHRARKQELEVANRIKGKVIAGSGCGHVKGDVRLPGVARIECKTTKNKSFPVTLAMVEKLEEAVLGSGEMPILVIEFNDGEGNKLKEVVVCPSYVLDSLIGE